VDEAFAAGEHAFFERGSGNDLLAAGHNCASLRKEA